LLLLLPVNGDLIQWKTGPTAGRRVHTPDKIQYLAEGLGTRHTGNPIRMYLDSIERGMRTQGLLHVGLSTEVCCCMKPIQSEQFLRLSLAGFINSGPFSLRQFFHRLACATSLGIVTMRLRANTPSPPNTPGFCQKCKSSDSRFVQLRILIRPAR